MTANITAASATVRVIGPGASWLWAMGTIPVVGSRPRVGFSPTTPFIEDGQTIDPSVSVPTAAAANPDATAAAEPALEPQALWSRA